jgi:hypothetical protein
MSGATSTIAVAAIVAGVPLLTVILTGWQQHRSRELEWARQDKVADRLLAANNLVSVRQDKVAARLLTANGLVSGKLDQIHELVNSTLTTALEGELTALWQLMRALESGSEPAAGALASTADRIAALESRLTDRARQTRAADAARELADPNG